MYEDYDKKPFITSGYVSADYFCDRRFESETVGARGDEWE